MALDTTPTPRGVRFNETFTRSGLFPRAYNSFIKFLNKGREIARELDVPLRDIKYFALKTATFTVQQKYVTACGK